MQFDIYTLIFAGLAIFVALKLKSVLGTRNGDEKPPQNPFESKTKPDAKTSNNDNVIAMPRYPVKPPADEPAPWRWEGLATEGTPLASSLDTLVNVDKGFDPRHFMSGAKSAYEMIISAFAHTDRKTLQNLLAPDVFAGFNNVMTGREQRNEKAEVTFVSIDKADLIDAQANGTMMQVSVRFQSKMISVTRDNNGAVVDGNPELISDITDIWTFARDAGTKDPNWKLVATEAGH